ncbi:spermidine synthase [Arthrobacter psychrochitiniphilus]|uniref:spermidine synthase n=1 Tax=Arthrobacter psychrochitiniphilus TaxID=291045 RepID=UPI00147401BC|nr:fused MFS/spermidine synthase [Arthrobacter psychrochitiniphilus]NYG18017.1 spermidine synthase [Arthrobacter psychrochitiniphilus]
MAIPSRFLRTSGVHATIEPDPWHNDAFVLSIDGAEQSHVNLVAPHEVFYEYLRRIANAIDLVKPAGEHITALHLGAGALTLARFIQATRPGSVQHAVELERGLLDFVMEALPLPAGTVLNTHVGDAREEMAALPLELRFDVIILDIFSGPEAPAHLACADFYREAAARLAPGGVLAVNVGDEPGFTLVTSQTKAMQEAMSNVAAYGTSMLFSRRYPGNIILLGRNQPWPDGWAQALVAAGPHPATVLAGTDVDELTT